jgi:acetate kinase
MPGTSASTATLLTINGGSSSIKFALFATRPALRRIAAGHIERIGSPHALFKVEGDIAGGSLSRSIRAPNYVAAVKALMDWINSLQGREKPAAIGHRIVHGGPKYWRSQRVTPQLIKSLGSLSPFDPEHLPEEILLTAAIHRRFPSLPQVACFDTAFHHDLPRVARLLPIPRRYEAKGLRRYGFHGLSCTYLIQELARLAGTKVGHGRVILAHLGNGASLTAVRHGQSVDTSMCFTPTAGLPMSTRSGDLDPGIAAYLARTEKMSPERFYRMATRESGLLGISETSSDMRDLLAREKRDVRAAEAVAVFCYHTAKWISAMTAALQGLDTLVFAGGIGENSAAVRARICRQLEWLGIKLDARKNRSAAPVISTPRSKVTVRVIPTDEELIIAQTVSRILRLGVN